MLDKTSSYHKDLYLICQKLNLVKNSWLCGVGQFSNPQPAVSQDGHKDTGQLSPFPVENIQPTLRLPMMMAEHQWL